MNKMMIILRLLEIAPRFIPKKAPKGIDWEQKYQDILPSPTSMPTSLPTTIPTSLPMSMPTSLPTTIPTTTQSNINLPTTDETILELKRRLAKELYRMEMDLAGGGRIAGKPCDCLSGKHHLGLEATVEELIPMEANPVYAKVIDWLNLHSSKFEIAEVSKTDPEYYQSLAPELRALRKQVLGTENLVAMLNDEEKQKLVKKVEEKANGE